MDPKEIEARLNAIRKGGECLEAVDDPASMQALLTRLEAKDPK